MNAYVLVGGRSRRMGRSKTRLFFDRVLAAACPVFDEVIAVHRADGAAIDGVRTIFEEEHEGEAPIFGVIRALEDAGGRAFVLAVDYPNITTEVLRFVRDRGGIPVWDGEPQLLCAVWDARRLGELRSHVAKGRFDLRGVIGHEMISEAELRSRFGGEPLRNVNTPEEWEGAERGG